MNKQVCSWRFILTGAILCPVLFFLGSGGLFLGEGNLNSLWKNLGMILAPISIFTAILFVGTLALSLLLWKWERLRAGFVLSLRIMELLMVVIGVVMAVSLALSRTF